MQRAYPRMLRVEASPSAMSGAPERTFEAKVMGSDCYHQAVPFMAVDGVLEAFPDVDLEMYTMSVMDVGNGEPAELDVIAPQDSAAESPVCATVEVYEV
ncbi:MULTISPECIES: hypothetical protein [unclassified Thioalkalivibrio]|uniref:hypothetical protein n=1 Tax=unclassified Thioalkalivibrio TaxID=2621013 RepID=UPI00037D766D|nr:MULTISPECIES: hypothetical protein [unclassified Thioalkalivibrio]